MRRCIRGEQRRNRDIGRVAASVHRHESPSSRVVADDQRHAAAALYPFDLFQEATATATQQDDLPGYFSTLLQGLDVGVFSGMAA
jgi:hypothetical protein